VIILNEDIEDLEIIENLISSKQKGNITENRIVELVTLGSMGQLTCYLPNSDDDGIDLIVNMKGNFNTLYLQVKSRYKLSKQGKFIQNVGVSTFKANERFYIVFVYFNESNLEIENIWLIPSIDFQKIAFLKQAGDTYKSFFRITANPNQSNDRWDTYKIDKTRLGTRLLEVLKGNQDAGSIS
jgi:hypothetical protein